MCLCVLSLSGRVIVYLSLYIVHDKDFEFFKITEPSKYMYFPV